MDTSTEKMEQAKTACTSAFEHLIKFFYFTALATVLGMNSLFLSLRDAYYNRTEARKMETGNSQQ